MVAPIKTVRVKALVSAVYTTPEGLPVTLDQNVEYDLPENLVDEFVSCGHAEVIRRRRRTKAEMEADE